MSALPNPSIPKALTGLIERATQADGQPPFSDQSLVELARGERILLERDHGAALLAADEFELVIDPDARGRGHGTALLEAVLARTPAPESAWAHGDHPGSRALAARFGFESVRTLLQLHADVPTAAPMAGRTIPFKPDTDDTAWLALNARAFSDHPEQGRLTQRDLDARMAEPWFDAGDFLLLWDNDRLVAFCWLKVEGAIGEFYAVGVDPTRQGEGFGRVIMDAGLARLAEHGIRKAALYVEADNEPALALYKRYGFARQTIDVRYSRQPH